MTYICICSKEYINYYRALYKSLKKFSSNSKQILYAIGDVPKEFDEIVDITEWFNNCNPKYNTLERICSLRARVVLDAFDKGNKEVIFCGAKIKYFKEPVYFEHMLKQYDAVVTPHILEPLPDDGKFPSNSSVSFTGHISTDLVGFKDTPEIRKFLIWQDEIMKNHCKTTSQTYLDQSWLNFLPFFVNRVHILRDPRYNCAYWNTAQRKLEDTVCFQFSGLDLNNPSKISTHQNREVATGDYLKFLEDYAKEVK